MTAHRSAAELRAVVGEHGVDRRVIGVEGWQRVVVHRMHGGARLRPVRVRPSAAYRVVGVDFSSKLVARVKEAKPAVNVAVGDARALDFEDRSLGAYISLGVVEHYRDGMGGILLEVRRVPEDVGVLLLSVPHFSPLFRRRADRSFGRASGKRSKSGRDFYQFYFTKAEIER